MSDDPRYEFKNPEIEAKLKDIGQRVGDAVKGSNYGFALFLYEFGEGDDKGLFYIANGRREDVVKMLHEFLDRNKP